MDLGYDRNWLDNHLGSDDSTWEAFDNSDFVNDLKSLGYDGASFREADPDTKSTHDVHVAFHPNQVKSIFNTNFDPEDPKFASGGSVAARILDESGLYSKLEELLPTSETVKRTYDDYKSGMDAVDERLNQSGEMVSRALRSLSEPI